MANLDNAIERKRISNEKISSMGIPICEGLTILEDEMKDDFRSLEEICKRAIACLISIQLACDINNGAKYNEAKDYCLNLLNSYGVYDYLISKEKRLFDGNYSNQDVLDVTWSYECYWSLVWALGLVDDDEYNPNTICDCERAIQLVSESKTLEDFINKCNLRDLDDILGMLDLYYRYHWACVEKRINPDTFIADLNPEVVYERRRGLEWLFSDEDDWFEISLDT